MMDNYRTKEETDKLMGRNMGSELTELRAFKAACEKQEAVAEVYSRCVSGFTDVIDLTRAKLNRKEKLYRHQDPEAAKLRLRVKELEAQIASNVTELDEIIPKVEALEDQVAKLTEQRDLAVEALRSVVFGSGDWFNLMPATLHDSLCDYLAAIKSSEVKK